MKEFDLKPSKIVSDIKNDIEKAIKNDIIEDNYDSAYNYMLKIKNKYEK